MFMKFWVVDAFSSAPFKGNPAAVIIVDEFPAETLMQNIAAEMRHSQTAFVKKLADKHFHIRWFSPNSEAPICGHATVASFHVMLKLGMVSYDSKVIFESMHGQLIVMAEKNGWITLNFPQMFVTDISPAEQEEYSAVVDNKPLFIGFSQGCIFMEYSNKQEIINLQPNLERLEKIACRALIVTSRDDEYDFVSRYFAPKVGIPEDPVCASAHCRLIPYWANKLQKQEMIALQASKRGGILKCKNLVNRVLIAGQAVEVMEGTLHI
jgi:PhzF family phenazine biosynthesis protein